MKWLFKIDRYTVQAMQERQNDDAKVLDAQTIKEMKLSELDEAIEEKKLEMEALRLQAEDVLLKAQKEAEGILLKTQKEADVLKKEAWQEGYQLGREEAQEIVDDAQKARKAEMERFMEQLRQTRDEILSGMEAEIIDFCMTVAEKVVSAALDRDDALFLSIITNALQKIRREGRVIVQVNPEDFQRYFESDTARFAVQGEEVTVSVTGNNRLKKGGCIVETDSDRVDTGVDTLFGGIRQALKNDMKVPE
ncbi:MAG: FliH/SctL family protein [Bacillota bacterium]